MGRYGIGNWGPLYLQSAKGYSITAAGSVMAAYPMCNLIGSVSSGFVSDYLFGSRRTVPALIYGLLEVVSLLALYWIPPGHPFLDAAALAAFGLGMGGLLVYLGGLMAIDLVSRRAAGAAMGLVGLFSYLVAGVQDTLSGYLLDASKVVVNGTTTYSFRLVFAVWIGALVFPSCWLRPCGSLAAGNRSIDMKIVLVGHVCVDKNVVRGETETLYGGGVVHGAITAQRLGAEATVVTKCAESDRPSFNLMSEAGASR